MSAKTFEVNQRCLYEALGQLITMLVSEAPKTLNPKGFFAQLGPIDRAGTAQQLWEVAQAKYRPAHRFRGHFQAFSLGQLITLGQVFAL